MKGALCCKSLSAFPDLPPNIGPLLQSLLSERGVTVGPFAAVSASGFEAGAARDTAYDAPPAVGASLRGTTQTHPEAHFCPTRGTGQGVAH